ncbi:MAG: ATP-grasp domain-containing protein, partial [Elstera sp.]
MSSPCALIVDPYSTGVLFADYLRARGYRCIAVQSGPELVESLLRTYRPDDYEALFSYTGDLDALLTQLSGYDIRCVLPGNESAVELADALGGRLGVRGNDPATTKIRRNKFEMIERITAAGLHAARQKLVSTEDEAGDWAKAHARWPVVIKPLDSASTDNVHVCHSEAEVRDGFQRIVHSRNLCGLQNTRALVQSYLDGLEYVVNTVSRDGRHYICDILESRKRSLNGSPLIYDFYRLLAPHGDVQDQLSRYIIGVLDALEIRNGGGHAEIRMTAEGPALIEIAARAMGPLGSTTTIAHGTGHDQAELIVDALTEGTLFDRLVGTSYSMNKHAMVVYLPSTVDGVLGELPILDHLNMLPSLKSYQLIPKIGGRIQRTIDLTSVLAKIYLVHEDG